MKRAHVRTRLVLSQDDDSVGFRGWIDTKWARHGQGTTTWLTMVDDHRTKSAKGANKPPPKKKQDPFGSKCWWFPQCYRESSCVTHWWLVSTPLKNDGVRQIGSSSQLGKIKKCSKPPIRYIYIYKLVGGIPTPPKNMSSSLGIIIPNWMESHKIYVPNHQPGF